MVGGGRTGWRSAGLGGRTAVAAAALLALAARVDAERLPVHAYTTADGLPRDSVHAILADPQRGLWFATPEGLARFDGYTFTTYGPAQGLTGPSVTCLVETRGQELWAGTSTGPFALDLALASSAPHGVAKFRPLVPEDARYVTCLLEASDGTHWCGGLDGLRRMEPSGHAWKETAVELPWPTPGSTEHGVTCLLEAPSGTIWVGTTAGLFRGLSTPGSAFAPVLLAGARMPAVRALMRTRDGAVWAAHGGGLARLPNGDAARAADIGPDEALAHREVTSLFQSSDGIVWAGCFDGLLQLPAGARSFRALGLSSGLSDDTIEALAEDAAGNLWLGTESGGAMRLPRHGFTTFTEADGLGHSRIGQVLQDARGPHASGRLVVVDSRGSLDVFDGTRFTAVRPRLEPVPAAGSWGWGQFVLQDHLGCWWIPTGSGVYRFPAVARVEDLAWTGPDLVLTRADGLPSDNIFRLYEDSHGDVLIAAFSDSGRLLTRWERPTGRLVDVPASPGGYTAVPTAFREDRAGNLWLGLYDGALLRRAPSGHADVIAPPGAPFDRIRDLSLDASGRLWIAGEGGGVARIDTPDAEHPTLTAWSAANGLSSNDASCVVEGNDGHEWVGTARGLDRLDPATGQVQQYTTEDGLANGYVNVAFREPSGALWFGTLRGLSREVAAPERRVPPPPVWINDLRVAGRSWGVSDLGERHVEGVRLRGGEHRIEIGFFAVSLSPGEGLRYQWMLQSADSTWSTPSPQRRVTYDSLAPGSYRFLVRSVDTRGVPGDTPAEAAITVERPLWRQWWFFLVAAAAGTGVGLVAVRARVRRLLDLERIRTRIAADLHDDIGAGLSQVAILSEVARHRATSSDPGLVEPLERMALVSRELVDSMSDIVWAIDPSRDALGDLVHRMRRFASDVFTARKVDFRFEFHVGEEELRLGADVRRQVFLIYKEAVNNAARHSACSRASITLRRHRDSLILVVEDDGVGFEVDADTTGHGIGSLHARARSIGAWLDVVSNEGQGTRVMLQAPLRRWGRMSDGA